MKLIINGGMFEEKVYQPHSVSSTSSTTRTTSRLITRNSYHTLMMNVEGKDLMHPLDNYQVVNLLPLMHQHHYPMQPYSKSLWQQFVKNKTRRMDISGITKMAQIISLWPNINSTPATVKLPPLLPSHSYYHTPCIDHALHSYNYHQIPIPK